MNIKNLKTHWVFGIKNIIVAGGFFRDNFLGEPIKDIDIFCTPANHGEVRKKLNSRIAEDITIKIAPGDRDFKKLDEEKQTQIKLKYEQQKTLSITTLATYITWQGELVDLIVTERASSALTLIETFDYTVNALAWPGESGQLAYDRAAWRDLWAMELNPIREASEERKKYMMSKGFREKG